MKEEDDTSPVIMDGDEEGSLQGWVLFFSRGPTFGANQTWGEALHGIEELARSGRLPSCSPADRALHFQQAEALGHQLWSDFKRKFQEGRATPGFGQVSVTLLRSGQCNLDAVDLDLFTTREMKAAQRLALSGDKSQMVASCSAASASAARQVFFFIRDLAHRHYHHEPRSDLLTTTHEWLESDDETWRRETQYGLARLAIAARRRDTAESYKQSLGLVAYAEAFQKHLCGWVTDATGTPRRSKWRFAYDFAALRQSIDASLKVRELKDTQRRQRTLFVFGFIVTCLGLILAGLRVAPDKPLPDSAALFLAGVAILTRHPIMGLIAAGIVSYAFDVAATHFSAQPRFTWGWTGGLSRLVEATMGTFMEAGGRRWPAFFAGWALLMVTIFGIVVLSGLAYYYAYRAIAQGGF